MRIHLIGVSGTGMGALAALLREAGEEVTGSDVAFDPPIGPTLQAAGVRCISGYDACHLEDPRPGLVVVGNAIRRDNPEATETERLDLPRASMSATLRQRFLAGRRPLVVAGSHGKTTTSAMCAWVLSRAGHAPGYFIGGVPKGLPGGAAIGSTRIRPDRGRSPFVVEGDEYDAVYWHKKPKFLDYVGVAEDDVAILTSVEHDHVDIYPDVASYEGAFRAFVRAIPAGGVIVCDAHDARARTIVAEEARARAVYYALEGDDTGGEAAGWLGVPAAIQPDGAQTFDLFAGGVACGRFVLRVPGRHNIRNAVAAVAACAEGFHVSERDARRHLASFEGVRRRQELLGEPGGVRVYDDFAHHPTAVVETLRALRARHPDGTLWVAFEPRSATACRATHQEAYARSFQDADRVFLAPLARTAIPEAERLDLQRLARELGPKARAVSGVDEIVTQVCESARAGDTVAVLSNGAFDGIQRKLVDALGDSARHGAPRHDTAATMSSPRGGAD
ncbi:MAG TPA: Mur ligase family protein [Polyangiaceae bacterium]|nr:Mur ligase family protein [Polyangiaceae bacterium]